MVLLWQFSCLAMVQCRDRYWIETSSIAYSISRRILKHEHTQKHPSHLAQLQAIWLAYAQKRKASPPWHTATKSAASPFTARLKPQEADCSNPKPVPTTVKRDYPFVAIDDFSRELYAAILPDKTADSAAKFLTEHLIDPCPYLIECVYSDNGTEYKGSANHAFGVACYENGIGQKFTRVARPQTNGKAERVIRTLMEMWHEKQSFESPEHRQKELCRFVNFYNTVKPHRSLNSDTPLKG